MRAKREVALCKYIHTQSRTAIRSRQGLSNRNLHCNSLEARRKRPDMLRADTKLLDEVQAHRWNDMVLDDMIESDSRVEDLKDNDLAGLARAAEMVRQLKDFVCAEAGLAPPHTSPTKMPSPADTPSPAKSGSRPESETAGTPTTILSTWNEPAKPIVPAPQTFALVNGRDRSIRHGELDTEWHCLTVATSSLYMLLWRHTALRTMPIAHLC
jgi:hypothetical protein